MKLTEFEAAIKALGKIKDLRDRLKRDAVAMEREGVDLCDRAEVELSLMEIAICYGAIDKLLEGL